MNHLDTLEAESIHILREVAANFERPVLLYSIGKDSSVLLHLARKAFHLAKPPFPLLHIDTTWKFREMISFRDKTVQRLGLRLIVHINEEGLRAGIDPIRSGSALHTDVMKTQALRQALAVHRLDAAIGGARRDEERSRAKERVFSQRSASQRWDPKNQRPELWRLHNARRAAARSQISPASTRPTNRRLHRTSGSMRITSQPRRWPNWFSTICGASPSRLSGATADASGAELRPPLSDLRFANFRPNLRNIAQYCASPSVPDNLCATNAISFRLEGVAASHSGPE
jgi:3'-phosphoadenosine 5'-phosphosulfate sulfotransferase (PAPS reductase)/FAD synthetase